MSVLSPPSDMSDDLAGYDRALFDDVRRFGQVTSWWRTVEHNQAVGGAADSQHLIGWAVDLVPHPGGTLAQLRDAIQAGKAYAWTVVFEADHVHVQIFPAGVATAWVRAYRR